MNSTMEKFGYRDSLIREYDHWAVLVRPAQVTLGSLVLAARGEVTAYGDLTPAAFAEQSIVIPAIEQALRGFCSYERINYLMLMMVDPHVHFHVIPRYSTERQWDGVKLVDAGWPGLPDLSSAIPLNSKQMAAIRNALAKYFN